MGCARRITALVNDLLPPDRKDREDDQVLVSTCSSFHRRSHPSAQIPGDGARRRREPVVPASLTMPWRSPVSYQVGAAALQQLKVVDTEPE